MLRQAILAQTIEKAISACEKGQVTLTLVALKAISACEKGVAPEKLDEELTSLRHVFMGTCTIYLRSTHQPILDEAEAMTGRAHKRSENMRVMNTLCF